MRNLLPVVSVIVLLGCGNAHTPPAELDGGVVFDALVEAPPDAADVVDAFVPEPTPEDAHDCAAWARYTCGRYVACYSAMIWIHGSRERCEDALRAECEHEESLEDTGDLAAARIECATEFADGCDWTRQFGQDIAHCDRPTGTREIGEPCRSDLQCGEGETSDGRTVRLRCFRDTPREPACDSGTCQLPLEEGSDCSGVVDTIDHDRCDIGLACSYDSSSGERCAPAVPAALDEPCVPNRLTACEPDLVCGAESTCERIPTNGQACDPEVRHHCGGVYSARSQYCNETTRVCTPLLHAVDGEACIDGPGGPSCGLSSDCVDGTCVPVNAYLARGAACSDESECRTLFGCVDGVCGAVPCE